MKTALIIWGGWEGHQPRQCADIVAPALAQAGFRVELSDTLAVLADKDKTAGASLIVPVWTCGTLDADQTNGLLEAVKGGVGLAGWHGGMGDAFRDNCAYQFMTGGQWVAHPDGILKYKVNIIKPDDPIVAGIEDFEMTSEQYYMHVDPSNEVLATTTFHDSTDAPWINGCVMPVVWKRSYGRGRVFYSSLGHTADEFLKVAEMLEILKRGMLWAARQ